MLLFVAGKGHEGDSVSRQHCKGCNCKRSGCLKNYCECYEVWHCSPLLPQLSIFFLSVVCVTRPGI